MGDNPTPARDWAAEIDHHYTDHRALFDIARDLHAALQASQEDYEDAQIGRVLLRAEAENATRRAEAADTALAAERARALAEAADFCEAKTRGQWLTSGSASTEKATWKEAARLLRILNTPEAPRADA